MCKMEPPNLNTFSGLCPEIHALKLYHTVLLL